MVGRAWIDRAYVVISPKSLAVRSHIIVLIVVIFELCGLGTADTPSGKAAVAWTWSNTRI